MTKQNILHSLQDSAERGNKQIALLVDPDKVQQDLLDKLEEAEAAGVLDFVFIGGSLISEGNLDNTVRRVKERLGNTPVVLFPGASFHISERADGILFLSLVSGRNPEFLIGQQVLAAPRLSRSNLEVCPTAYLLIDGGAPTSASYMSNTLPIPGDKPDIAACTALAANMMGMKMVFMDAGSGAKNAVSPEMVSAVRSRVNCPIIVGGGLRSSKAIQDVFDAGADLTVIGSMFEQEAEEVIRMLKEVKRVSKGKQEKIIESIR